MQTAISRRRNSAFTLVEVMMSTVLLSVVCSSVFMAFKSSVRWTRAGTSQAQFLGGARVAADNVVGLIERGKAFSVATNGVQILFPDLTYASIYFDSGDGQVATVEDNRLVYDPLPSITGDEYTLCTFVRPVDGDAVSNIFQSVVGSPDSLAIRFHVGDGTNVAAQSFSGTGLGYQGTEVRISATPRNLQRWYD